MGGKKKLKGIENRKEIKVLKREIAEENGRENPLQL